MMLRLGYDLTYDCPDPTPMILALNVHFTRVSDMITPDHVHANPSVPMAGYRDGFGNWCTRIVAPAGRTRLYTDAVIRNSGLLEPVVPEAVQHPVRTFPKIAWPSCWAAATAKPTCCRRWPGSMFGNTPPGWPRVQAICDFVHRTSLRLRACPSDTGPLGRPITSGNGVCRDFAHLAVTFCRCMNIPARY